MNKTNLINQVNIAYNGDLVITGILNGNTKIWVLSQDQALTLLKDIK